jgi:hypothetical protein
VEQFLQIKDFIPLVVKNLKSVHDEAQLEAAWCLTNIASSTHEHTTQVIGAVPDLINYLSPHFGNNSILQEQCVWALGNIAGDCVSFSRLLVRNGALSPLTCLVNDSKVTDVVKTAAWCLANIAHGIIIGELSPETIDGWTPERYIQCLFDTQILNTIHKVITDPKANPLVVSEVVWLLSHLSRVSNYELVFRLVSVPYDSTMNTICRLLENSYNVPNPHLLIPCLRILGNVLRGPDNVIEHVISSQPTIVGSILIEVLSGTKSELLSARKESAWVIANLCAGSPLCIDGLVRFKYLEHVLKIYTRSEENDDVETKWLIKRELSYALTNLTGDGRYLNVEVMTHILMGMRTMILEIAQVVDGEADDHDQARAQEVILLVLNFWKFLLMSPLRENARVYLKQSCADAVQRVQEYKSTAPVTQLLQEVITLL